MKTQILKPSEITQIADILKKGGIIIYPTETSYGLGCDWTNKIAVERIYKIKGRNKSKKLNVIMPDIIMVKKNVKISKEYEALIRKFMPGPLTLISDNDIAFRISSNETATGICKALNKPLVSTSANISGKGDNYKIKDIIKIFGGRVDAIIDGGNLKKRRPSTIFDVKDKRIIRKGPVSEKRIFNALKQGS